jgi:hypothetical protein
MFFWVFSAIAIARRLSNFKEIFYYVIINRLFSENFPYNYFNENKKAHEYEYTCLCETP